MNTNNENDKLSFTAIQGVTEGFTSLTLRNLQALKEKIAETTCKQDALELVNDLITGYTESRNSFLGNTFSKRKNSSSDNGDNP